MSDEKSPNENKPEASATTAAAGAGESQPADGTLESTAQQQSEGAGGAIQPEADQVGSGGAEQVGNGETSSPESPSTGSSETATAPELAASPKTPAGGPINLDRIRELRKSQQGSVPPARQKTGAAPAETKPDTSAAPKSDAVHTPSPKKGKVEVGKIKTPEPQAVAPKVAVPSVRERLAPELEDELAAAVGASGDLDSLLIGDSMLQVGVGLTEGQRMQAKVMKTRGEHVFVSLGGPNEGVLAAIQFEEPPEAGAQIEVIVRGFLADEGLFELALPGSAIEVTDWDDLREGEVIEVLVTGSNSGGLECKAGAIRGFIPASQVAEYRIEDFAEFVDQKVMCVITEANPRRGNLVLSRRAVLEREKREKREERLAALSVGDAVEGTVRKILDFGAFVDIGGLDGLLHISQLSWERVNHPSEIVEEGQKIQVRVEKIDEQTGKIGLSYRSLQEHPWTDIEERFPVGSIINGTVSRIAEFGAFVKIATGVEGLVHLSELAHHRVHRVSNVVQEGQEVEVKVLSTDADSQRMSLSIKAVQAAPVSEESAEQDAANQQPPPEPVLPKHTGPLKGGTGQKSGGEDFGLKW